MLISSIIASAILIANASACETVTAFEANSAEASYSQGVVVRQNAHLRCNAAGADLYLYSNGSFKIINRDEALKGTYSIEDGENLVLNADGYRATYGKIYFRGTSVSRVVLDGNTFYPL